MATFYTLFFYYEAKVLSNYCLYSTNFDEYLREAHFSFTMHVYAKYLWEEKFEHHFGKPKSETKGKGKAKDVHLGLGFQTQKQTHGVQGGASVEIRVN